MTVRRLTLPILFILLALSSCKGKEEDPPLVALPGTEKPVEGAADPAVAAPASTL